MVSKSSSAFNLSELTRTLLMENPNQTSKELFAAVMAKHPSAKINKNSFNVSYYTIRKKLGIGSSTRASKFNDRPFKSSGQPVGLATMLSAAKLLNEAGSIEAAIEANKLGQAIQLK